MDRWRYPQRQFPTVRLRFLYINVRDGDANIRRRLKPYFFIPGKLGKCFFHTAPLSNAPVQLRTLSHPINVTFALHLRNTEWIFHDCTPFC